MTTALEAGLSPIRAVLPNGAVVLVQENATAPAVAITATFVAGSAHDPISLPGVAYLTGKTLDRGAQGRSAAEIAELLDDRGVALRVFVARHTVTISSVCLAEDFESVLALLTDILQHPSFPDEEVEKRRLEAITSVRQDDDNPAVVSGDALLGLLYGPDHPYGRPIKGTPETLEQIGRQDLLAFHRDHLVPSALRLAIVGDVAPARAVDAATRRLESWRGPAASDPPIPAPPAPRRLTKVLPRPGKAQTDIAYGFTTVRRVDPRYYAYWMMNNILGQFGLGGRLADNIRERQGMAYYAYSSLDAMPAEGPLVIRAGVDPQNVARTLEAIDAEVRALGTAGPTPQEFADTRESLVGSVPRFFETNESIADFLLWAEQYGLGLDFDRQLPGLLRAVTFEEVRDAARELLDPARAAVVIAGPHAEDDAFDAEPQPAAEGA